MALVLAHDGNSTVMRPRIAGLKSMLSGELLHQP